MKSLSRFQLFATLWTVAYQAPLSMGFSRQQYWSGLPFPSPEDLPDPGIKPRSPAMQADALSSEPPGKSYIMPIRHIMSQMPMFYSFLWLNNIPAYMCVIYVMWFYVYVMYGLPRWLSDKKLPANAGNTRDVSSIPRLGRSPGVGNANPLWYSHLEYSVDRGTYWFTVHMVLKCQTWLSMQTCTLITKLWVTEEWFPAPHSPG